ncbi:MAG TPA: efflux RND transporter periplasmic adaptor subunit, partial [Tepidisphaeraceae bacterium]|nr:efflux RND transporter periplasmic adaptor subunit [Tepidisphaeraceae bacterium]
RGMKAELAGVLSLLMAAVGCNRGQQAAATMPPPAVTVAIVVVQDVPFYIDEIGRCAANKSVSIMPEVAGRIDSASFVEGVDVKQGDLLFTIDPRPFKAALSLAEATVAQNQANLKFAKEDFARVVALKGTSAVSQTEYDQKESANAVAEANVEAAKASVETAKLNLEYCEIRSPINGRSGMRLVDPGNVVKADEGTLVTIQSLDPIYADFTIPENRLVEVRSHMANGTLKTIVGLPQESLAFAQGGVGATTKQSATTTAPTSQPVMEATAAPTTQPLAAAATVPTSQPLAEAPKIVGERTGQLSMLDNSILGNSGTIRLRATIPNADEYFWPGQFVHVRLVLVDKPNAILVPNQAIQIGQIGTFVYVVKHDDAKNMDLADMRPVKLGQRQGDLVVIDSGLTAADRVIVTGQLMVQPNAPVTVVNSPAAPGAVAMEGKS